MQTKAARRDYEDFLLSAYFGEKCLSDPKAACIDRAYLDFSRTLRGFALLREKQRVHEDAITQIKSVISDLNRVEISNQEQFDAWHQATCVALKDIYDRRKFNFHMGQAQKWINMTMKYIYTFGDDKIAGFSTFYPFCHVPIDNKIIERLTDFGFPKPAQAWSKMDYPEYFSRQEWIRRTFTMLPLDIELFAWMRRDFNLAAHLRKTLANTKIG